MAAPEAQSKRPEPTGPGRVSELASGLVGRVRGALGGRNVKAEVAGYRLALKDAGPSQVGVIVDRLLEIVEADGSVEALTLVASVFERLEPAKRERAIVTGHGMWGRACGGAAIDVDADVRLSAATVIGRICERETFGALREMLADQDERVSARAGESLLAIADRVGQSPALDGETVHAVERMVIKSVDEFERHRRREAMGALLSVCSSPAAIRAAGPELRAWMSNRDHPAHMILRGMLRRGDAMASRESAWLWLGHGEHRAGCVERLSAPCDAAAHERVLVNSHLMHNPTRRSALAGAAERDKKRRNSGLSVDADVVETLSPRARAGCAAWIACVEGDRAGEALESLLTAPGDLTRYNALRELATRSDSDLAMDFCFDASARLARSAALAVGTPSSRGRLGVDRVRRTLQGLAFASTGATRETAQALAEATDPMAMGGAGMSAVWRMLRANRAGLVSALQAQVRTGAGPGRVRAIQLAARLGITAHMELELLSIIALSTHAAGDSANQDRRDVLHAAAAAVTALADLPSPAAQHAVHKCLRHPDDRVRANALDAMTHGARRAGSIGAEEQILAAAAVEFKDDPHHRVRAAAARARLLGAARSSKPEASPMAETLMPMLKDGRPMHRVSGLWLAERAAGLGARGSAMATGGEVAAAVAEMVKRDPSPEIRVRARMTATHLLAHLHEAPATTDATA